MDFVGSFDIDVVLREKSVDGGFCAERRILSALALGTDPRQALSDCSELLEILRNVRLHSWAPSRLADVLERPGGDFVRAIYFAQAGRGIRPAVENLEWLVGLLRDRQAIAEWSHSRGTMVSRPAVKFDRWLIRPRYVVDRDNFKIGRSLTCAERPEAAVCGYDLGLIGLSLKEDAWPLARALAGLSIGVGIDDALYCVTSVIEAFDDLRDKGCATDSRFGEILSGHFDDYQRALIFACVGRPWHEVYQSLGSVRSLLEERVMQWNFNKEAGIDVGPRTSPYIETGEPETFVFVAHRS